jgi:hypothetical protein
MLGFVGDLVPLFWSFEQIHLQWEIFREVEGLNSQICLYAVFGFHKVLMLALYGFSLLVCPQPLGHNSPHRKVIQNELIRQRSIKKSLVIMLVMYLGLVNCVF